MEIVNLSAILSLPKGTEFFLSDLHGEHDAFVHMLKSASGVIRNKIDDIFGPTLSIEERDALAALVYNARAEMERRKKSEPDFDKWCKVAISQLTQVLKSVTNKYTQSKVRKRLPKQYAYKAYPFLFGPLSFVGHFGLNHIEYRYNYLFTHESHADTSTEAIFSVQGAKIVYLFVFSAQISKKVRKKLGLQQEFC